jgi:hypothetical protein
MQVMTAVRVGMSASKMAAGRVNPNWPQRARLEVVPAVFDSGPRVRAGLYLAGGRPLRISGGGLAERARVARLAPIRPSPGRRSAASPSRGHDDRAPREPVPDRAVVPDGRTSGRAGKHAPGKQMRSGEQVNRVRRAGHLGSAPDR